MEDWILRFQPAGDTGRPALFLDRDGTIIDNMPYLSNPAMVRPIVGAGDAIRRFRAAGYLTIVVTNQSGIARGLLTRNEYLSVESAVLDALGVSLIDAIYACPFHPDHPQRFAELAGWRKPADGMLLAAAADYGLDLQRSILVGDSLSDVRAGWSAGLPAAAHVLTGHGVTERAAVIAAAEAEGGEHRARLMLVNSIADLCPSALRR